MVAEGQLGALPVNYKAILHSRLHLNLSLVMETVARGGPMVEEKAVRGGRTTHAEVFLRIFSCIVAYDLGGFKSIIERLFICTYLVRCNLIMCNQIQGEGDN